VEQERRRLLRVKREIYAKLAGQLRQHAETLALAKNSSKAQEKRN